ncbi:Prefoldin [Cynara cardunculus var. scolymus]|uniref:Prefoldin n=1 Tax=Cynara cardunculus var. scolymus TaxID=59895 RepID=A0A118K364_CYNCS|nr:Prefoldin [Cynara cardunculus var. scolymus]
MNVGSTSVGAEIDLAAQHVLLLKSKYLINAWVKGIPDYLQILLGEGYYAERTSKQIIEILKRRGKDLESQIETLNAVIKDLKKENTKGNALMGSSPTLLIALIREEKQGEWKDEVQEQYMPGANVMHEIDDKSFYYRRMYVKSVLVPPPSEWPTICK